MGNANSGRKPAILLRSHIENNIREGALGASRILKEVGNGVRKKPSPTVIETCKYLVNQAIGAPHRRIEIAPGEVDDPTKVTWLDLLRIADARQINLTQYGSQLEGSQKHPFANVLCKDVEEGREGDAIYRGDEAKILTPENILDEKSEL